MSSTVDMSLLRQRHRRPCYVLRIAGLPVLYGTHMPPEVRYTEGPLTTNFGYYDRRVGLDIDSISFSRRFDDSTRVVQVENLNLRLTSSSAYSADLADPGRVFGRIGYQGADAFSKVTAGVGVSDTLITVEDSSVFTTGLAHIGQETVHIYKAENSTQIEVKRGMLGTFNRVHRVDDTLSSFPYVTQPLVYFGGRKVVLYEGYLDDNGNPPPSLRHDYAEVFRGFMATEPATGVSGKTHEVTLEVAPLTAVLDKPLGGTVKKTNMHPQLHAFDGTVANDIAVSVTHEEGDMYESNAYIQITESNGQRTLYRLRDDAALELSARFDNDIADQHPRAFATLSFGSMPHVGNGYNPTFPLQYVKPQPNGLETVGTPATQAYWRAFYPNDPGTFFLNNNTVSMNNTSVPIKSAGSVETHFAKMAPTATATSPLTVNWRAHLASVFNDELCPGTLAGVNGQLVDLRYDENLGEMRIKPNFHVVGFGGGKPKCKVLLANSPLFLQNGLLETNEFINGVYIIGIGASPSAVTGNVVYQQALAAGPHVMVPGQGHSDHNSHSLPVEAFALATSHEDPTARVVEVSSGALNTQEGGVTVECSAALAFFHLGYLSNAANQGNRPGINEQYIVLENQIPSDGHVAVESDGNLVCFLGLSSETLVSVGGFAGYRYKITDIKRVQPTSVIADYSHDERHTFRPSIAPTEQTIGDLILQLLCSTDGKGVTSTSYDEQTVGAGLSDGTAAIGGGVLSYINGDDMGADIDRASFRSIPNPVAGSIFGPIYKEGDTLMSCIDGMLKSVGYTVDIRTDDKGRCRLCAVELGLPNSSNITQHFDESDIAQDPVPTSEAEIEIRNVFNFSLNYDWEGEADLNVSVRDQASIDLFNRVEKMGVELRGVRVPVTTPGDATHALSPIFSRLRIENSFPRRVFCFDVRVGLLHAIGLGSTCTVTHQLLRGQGGLGVTTEPCRVRSVEYEGAGTVGRIELVSYGTVGVAWNMSASIVSQSDAYTLSVTSNEHSPTSSPIDGSETEDLSGFKVGEYVAIYSAYDFDSPLITTQVSSIDLATNELKVTGAVTLPTDSLSMGFIGYVVTVDNDSSNQSANQKLYAHIGTAVST